MATSFAPGSVRRIAKDAKEATKGVDGIHYRHSSSCVTKAVAMIEGPEDTPYAGGFFLFAIEYPSDYPSRPPKLGFLTGDGVTRFHPNMYINGKVCLSMVNTWSGEKWTACMRILNVLVVLRSLFSDTPLLHEPGIPASHPGILPYTEAVRHATVRVAVLGLFDWINPACEELGTLLHIARSHIVANPDKYRDMVSQYQKSFMKLVEQSKLSSKIVVSVYKLNENIDYSALLAALEVKLKKHLDV